MTHGNLIDFWEILPRTLQAWLIKFTVIIVWNAMNFTFDFTEVKWELQH